MSRLYIERCAREIEDLTRKLDWAVVEKRKAGTGSIYFDLRRINECVTIRVSNHKQFYRKCMTMYSFAPGDLFYEQIEIILSRPYGQVGDLI